MTIMRSLSVLLAVIAAVAVANIPASAQQLKQVMGKTWGDKCIMAAGGATTCCLRERTAETACKDVDKERTGSPVRVNCEGGEKICQTMVRCDDKLNMCKKTIMATDKTCSTVA